MNLHHYPIFSEKSLTYLTHFEFFFSNTFTFPRLAISKHFNKICIIFIFCCKWHSFLSKKNYFNESEKKDLLKIQQIQKTKPYLTDDIILFLHKKRLGFSKPIMNSFSDENSFQQITSPLPISTTKQGQLQTEPIKPQTQPTGRDHATKHKTHPSQIFAGKQFGLIKANYPVLRQFSRIKDMLRWIIGNFSLIAGSLDISCRTFSQKNLVRHDLSNRQNF